MLKRVTLPFALALSVALVVPASAQWGTLSARENEPRGGDRHIPGQTSFYDGWAYRSDMIRDFDLYGPDYEVRARPYGRDSRAYLNWDRGEFERMRRY